MPTTEKKPPNACCMVSELLEEAGLDREHLRAARRQILEGIILMCQWQLRRMEAHEGTRPSSKKGRKVTIE